MCASSAGGVAVTDENRGRSIAAIWPGKPIITRNDLGSTVTFDGMTVVLASVIAVLGTLGGATASYLFQGKISERNESKARDERLQSGWEPTALLPGAVMDLRGIQYDRGYSRIEDHQLDRSSIRAESSRLRSVAWTAFYRFKLTSPDQQLTNFAAGRRGGFRRRRR